MCSNASEGGRTGSPRVSDAGRTPGGEARDDVGRADETLAASSGTSPLQAESASRRGTRDAALRLQAEVVRAWRAWETTRGKKVRWMMTLPELYLAYIAHTGEELRDALLRVANEPRSNPNRRKVHDLLAEHLGGVAAVTGPVAEGRFGEKIFHVHFFRQDGAVSQSDAVAPKPTPGLHAIQAPRPREGDTEGASESVCAVSVKEKILWSPEPKRPRAPFAPVAGAKRRLSLSALAAARRDF